MRWMCHFSIAINSSLKDYFSLWFAELELYNNVSCSTLAILFGNFWELLHLTATGKATLEYIVVVIYYMLPNSQKLCEVYKLF